MAKTTGAAPRSEPPPAPAHRDERHEAEDEGAHKNRSAWERFLALRPRKFKRKKKALPAE